MDKIGIKTDFRLNNKYIKGDKNDEKRSVYSNQITQNEDHSLGVTAVTLVLPEPDGPTSIKPCLTTVVSYS